MKINVVINWSILISFVSNLSCSVYIVLHIPLHNSTSQLLSFSCRSMFNNLTWYQSLVQASNKSCLISIIYQKKLSFHINPRIITLLPLDYVQRILSKCDRPWESVHVKVERLETDMIANWIFFCNVFASIYVAS